MERAGAGTATEVAPRLEFTDPVPYDRYVQPSTLHPLQQPVTTDPGEMSFLMISQVMELYFGLVRFELAEAQRQRHTDDIWGGLLPLRRAAAHLEGLDAAWRGLAWMTPADSPTWPHPACGTR